MNNNDVFEKECKFAEKIILDKEKLEEKIQKASDYVKKHTDKLKTIRVPKIDFDYNEILKILENHDDYNNDKKIKFILDGCDISFYAEAPEDITLKQLLKQCDRIKADYCACGIKSGDFKDEDLDLVIDYDDVRKVNENVSCKILGGNDENNR